MESELASLGNFIFNVFVGLAVFVMIMVLLEVATRRRKSQDYRKYVMDMYVASKTRFFAKEDNLDLSKEVESFKSWLKKNKYKNESYDLDNAVEDELKDRIDESTPKKDSKKD